MAPALPMLPCDSVGDPQRPVGLLREIGVVAIQHRDQRLRLRRQVQPGARRPAAGGGRAGQDQVRVAADGKGGVAGGAGHRLQQPVEPAGAADRQAGRAGLEDVLAVEMAALVAIGGRDGMGEGKLPRRPHRRQRGQPGVQREALCQRRPLRTRQQVGAVLFQQRIGDRPDNVQPVHRAAQDDDDQAVVRGDGGHRHRSHQRVGGQRAGAHQRRLHQSASGQGHRRALRMCGQERAGGGKAGTAFMSVTAG